MNTFLAMMGKWKIHQRGMNKECAFLTNQIYGGRKLLLTPPPHLLLQLLQEPQLPQEASTGDATGPGNKKPNIQWNSFEESVISVQR